MVKSLELFQDLLNILIGKNYYEQGAESEW